jgi:predicted ATPase
VEALNFLALPLIRNHDIRPLDRSEVHELLCARCGVGLVQGEVVDSVCDRTSGNALYCIELANTMLQKGVLKVYNGVCNLSIPIEDLDTARSSSTRPSWPSSSRR